LTRVYRILRKRFARKTLDGMGAYLFGGRWSSPGTRLAYTSEHMSLAMIEYFVHLDPEEQPMDLVVVTAEIPDSVSRIPIPRSHLPAKWWSMPPPPELAVVGDDFARAKRTAILIVPSALVPSESNWLINPEHPDFRKIRVRAPEQFLYDPRFFR
jgi:RES domain-containing protein